MDARSAAWLRIAYAVALPYFFWSRGLHVLPVVPHRAIGLYTHVILTPWYWTGVLALCVLLALGRASRLVTLLLFGSLLPLAFLSKGSTSRILLLPTVLAFSMVQSGTVRLPWPGDDRLPASTAGPSWPVRLIQLQLSLLYGVNALAKSIPAYLRGDVLKAMSVALPNFKVDLSAGVLHLGFLSLPVAVAAVATVSTEYFLAVGFWFRRLKWLAALAGIVFHWLLTFVVQIYKLNLAAIFLYLVFLLPLVPGAEMPGEAARPTKD